MSEETNAARIPDDWSWVDPSDDTRFVRKEPEIQPNASTEARLQNIARLTDEIFAHLSIFEQSYAEPGGGDRGNGRAIADPARKLDIPSARQGLIEAEETLWNVYRALKETRTPFLNRQLQALGISEQSRGLKIHLGSASALIAGWLNVDACGGELMLNVNWGLPLPDECAAFMYSSHLLEHLRFRDQAPVFVREMYRVLAKGGTVRLVVPDLRKLLVAYAEKNQEYFAARQHYYPLSDDFVDNGVATLDYILLFCGANQQILHFNHKFGYDSTTLCKLLRDAGFSKVTESAFQGSAYPELRVDDFSYNTQAVGQQEQHYSLFVEATK